MIRAIDPSRCHANALEQQADNENQRQQAQSPSPAFALPGVQKGKGKTGQGDKRSEETGWRNPQSGTDNGIDCYQGIQDQQGKGNAAQSHVSS